MKLITPELTFAYSEWNLAQAIAVTKDQVPGLEIEVTDESPNHSCGWPQVRLIGDLPVLVEALKKWESGDAEEDLEVLQLVLKDTKPYVEDRDREAAQAFVDAARNAGFSVRLLD